MTNLPTIQRFETDTGVRIYRIPVEVFPNGFIGFVHLLLNGGVPTLVDTGSGFPQSNADILKGLESLKDDFGESIAFTDIQRIIVTHGHIDHFGGVAFMLEQTGGAQVGIHALDRRVLTGYEERVVIATKDLRIYLERAGIKPLLRDKMIEMYGFAKQHVTSVPVDFSLEEDTEIDGMTFFHTPGHCPGQVCIKIGDVLLSADHILSRTTPHQAPEGITHYTGLGHYADALRKMKKVDGIRLALGGHENPIDDVYTRIDEIRASHKRKLDRVSKIIKDAGKPLTISDISKTMYPDMKGYEILLAVEESAAHVEYLYQHGQLAIANLEQVEKEDNLPILYEIV